MKLLDKPVIEHIIAAIPNEELLACIAQAFVAYSNGSATVPPVGYLKLAAPGDVHIKYGHIKNDPYYVIKIASGFYNNPALGLPSSNGMMLVFNATTGAPECLLQDEGYLTDLRTALAGAIAAKHMAPPVKQIGILGTGIQARLQLQWLKAVTPCRKVLVYGRTKEKALEYQQAMNRKGFEVCIANSVQEVAQQCNLIVTTTPSNQPLIAAADVQPGTHITAMGADAEGKQELEASLLLKATVVCDSIQQCVDHGEACHAVKAGMAPEQLLEMGDVIEQGLNRTDNMITIADLTGIATQDIKIAALTLHHAD